MHELSIWLIILISSLVLAVSTKLFRMAAGTLNVLKPNMISFVFYYPIILQSAIAAFLISLGDVDHYVLNTVSGSAKFHGCLTVGYVMLTLPVGMLLSKYLLVGKKPMKRVLYEYTSKKIDYRWMGRDGLKYSIWLLSLCAILACMYVFYIIGYYPFIKIFNASFLQLAFLRNMVSRSFGGNVYIRNIIALGLTPLLSYMWLFYYWKKKNILDGIMFIVMFLFSASILFYDFEKSPILWYVLSFVFAYFYVGGRINKKYLVMSTVIVICAVYFFYSSQIKDFTGFFSFNSGPVGRIILSQAAGMYVMFDVFPNVHHFIGLASLSDFVSLLGIQPSPTAARIAMGYFNPVGVSADGHSGVMNSLFAGEAWANFGLLGLLISPLWVGFLIESLYIFFLKTSKNPLFLGLFVSLSVGGAVTGGFNAYIYNPHLLIVVFVAFAVIVTAYVLNRVGGKPLRSSQQIGLHR